MASRPEPQGALATEDRKRCGSTRMPFGARLELNRRLGWPAARPAYERRGGSDSIEKAIFTSAVHGGVGATAQLRAIRQAAYSDVQAFGGTGGARSTRRGGRSWSGSPIRSGAWS